MRRLLLVAGVAALAVAVRCERAEARSVTIKGSDTMVILAQRWIEVYGRSHPAETIELTGGGSVTGIAALLNGTTDLAASSVRLADGETARAEAHAGRRLREIPVAWDVLSIYVHPSNPVDALSLSQLRDILVGRLRRWSDVGGADAPIAIYGRESTSGSLRFLRQAVLGDEELAENVESLPGTGTVADNVARDPNGIGYGGIAYAHRVKHLAIRKADGAPAVEPSAATARNGDYRLARRLYLYGFEPLPREAESFVAWALGDEGQRVVSEVGYFPVGGP
ncbi:MAG TPA: phosphate ABC transporter substrate-binding protein [Burkholderiales bacterium]|nr:phosphate ABC transporter substrate-binding protein [Burkholderiales bacterium]